MHISPFIRRPGRIAGTSAGSTPGTNHASTVWETAEQPQPTRLGSRSNTPLLAVVLSGLFLAALSGGCARSPGLPGQLAELSCVGSCQGARDRCNADARYDYRQCQAGYSEAFVDYRRCLASAFERSECGYPWWSCAENLYGYCANRAAECVQACRARSAP
jgi:hypothetical protein